MTPLTDPGLDHAVSATVRDAFGTFGLNLPPSPAQFAVTLVHEFQHSKLNGLLDIMRLHERDERLYFAPWRHDPRPLDALFQGVYAFLGVADTWHLLTRDNRWRPVAERSFATARLQVDEGLRALLTSDRLTPAGVQFAAGIRTAVDGLLAVPLPDPVVADAHAQLDRSRRAWARRLRQTA